MTIQPSRVRQVYPRKAECFPEQPRHVTMWQDSACPTRSPLPLSWRPSSTWTWLISTPTGHGLVNLTAPCAQRHRVSTARSTSVVGARAATTGTS
jgi:hypothetical protein